MKNISRKIKRIRDIIVENYQPDSIILFGSHARGKATEKSDIDILVISDKEKQLPRYKRGLEVRIKLAEVSAPKDVLFYSRDDIDRWKGVPHTFVDTIFNEGVVLYER
jgi:predicted nucleotidyltransferase